MEIFVQKTEHDFHKIINDKSPPFGFICHNELEFLSNRFEYLFDSPNETMDILQLKLVIPQQDFMQYFIKWQRYRKYWWSSVTTTPSLFSIGDIKQKGDLAEVDIIAKLPCGLQSVEQIKISNDSDITNTAHLTCTMSLERALFIILLDGMNNNPKDEYLRLHRNIAPYKMSFALNFEDPKKKQSLKNLASLLFHRLSLENVSACLPDFMISSEEQILTNLQLGIPYTTILDESTLQHGILHLQNSSTMLKEQIHVADYHKYAALLCNTK